MGAKLRSWVGPNGKPQKAWAVSFIWTGPDGEKRRVRKSGFATRRQAEGWELEERQRLASETRTNNADMTLAEALDAWLVAAERGAAGRRPINAVTLRSYRTTVRLHLKPLIGHRKLVSITRPVVVEASETLLATKTRSVAAQAIRYLSIALGYAVDKGWLPSNPAARFRIDGARRQDQVRVPSETEMAAILSNLSERAGADPESWLGFAVLVLTLQGSGLRIGEARALAWDAVDLDHALIHVRRRADRWGVFGPPKSAAGFRTVAIDDQLVSALGHWRKHCPQGELVFPNGAGRVESLQNLYHRRWLPVMRELGLMEGNRPLFAFHAQRHFRVSRLIAAGANIRQIMEDVGHASSALTIDTYGHLMPEELAQRRQRANQIALSLDSCHMGDTNEAK